MSVDIDVHGLDDVRAFLAGLPAEAQVLLKNAVNKAALQVQTKARRNCPVDTGRLRSSIAMRIFEDGLAATVGSDLKYALWIEYGTGPAAGRPRYFPPPGALLEWMKRHGIDPGAEYAIARKIYENGTKPRPFLIPAYEEVRPSFLDDARKALKTLGNGGPR